MRDFLFGFLAAIALFLVGALGYLRLAAEVRADVAAPTWQSRLMQFAVRASVARNAPRATRPLLHTDEELITGGKLYLNGCAGCHGTPFRHRHEPPSFFPPPQLAFEGTRYSEPEIYWIIKHGIRRTGMSAYGPFYKEPELWALVAFVGRMKELPSSVMTALQPKKR